jgi:3-dehydroquinate dehydratase
MKNYSSYDNSASCLIRPRLQNFLEHTHINNFHDELSNSSYNSQTLNIVRSIVNELYEINNHEILSRNESKENCVCFILEQEVDKTESVIVNESKLTETSIKHQPVLSESSTVFCCLIKG